MDKAEEDYEEEVFTFFSCPHFAETGESSPQVFDDLSFDEGEGGRKEACLEDDFIGCESEEVYTHKHTYTISEEVSLKLVIRLIK